MAKNTVMSRAQEMAKEAFKKENLALSALGYGVGKLFPPFAIANGIYNIGKIGYGLLDATPKSLEDMMDNNNPQEIDHYAYGPITAADQYGILNSMNSVYSSPDVSLGDLDPASTDPARAEYETAINAMEYPDNPPNPADFYAAMNAPYTPDAVTLSPLDAISTLAGIGSGLLGSLGEAQGAMEGLGTTDVSSGLTGPSNEDYAYAMETPGLLGNVVSVPTTVASVGEVGDSAPNTGLYTGFPGATPGFSSLSQHNMSERDFIVMANMSDANSMAAKTGNAYNNFAANFAKNNPNSGYNDRQNAWEASRAAAIEAATALAKNEAAAANIDAGGGGSDGFDGDYGGGFDFSGGVDGSGEAGDSHSGWY
jgi:hypothetical protein